MHVFSSNMLNAVIVQYSLSLTNQNEQVNADTAVAGANTAAGFGTAASVDTAAGADAVTGAAMGAGSAVSDGAAAGVGADAGSAGSFASMEAVKRREGKRYGYLFCKRAVDIAFSLIVIVLLAIPMLVLCTIIRVESAGSPVYKQQRIGRGGKPITIYKLRTMVADADNVKKYLDAEQLVQWQAERKVENDPRITKVGRVLRATSLDEVPQFWNVLKGEMSVVGPRPIVAGELEWLGGDAEEYLSVRGGITGLWQTTSRNGATWESGERLAIELKYVRNQGPAMDARIFAATFGVMFGKRRSGR